jgi:uncharacterized protein YjdB
MRSSFFVLSFVLTFAGVGCSSNNGGTASDESVSAVSVSPSPCGVAPTDSQQLSAQATFADGTKQDVTKTATWTSSSTSTATVDSSGNVVGVAAGSVTITAAHGGQTGSAVCLVGP